MSFLPVRVSGVGTCQTAQWFHPMWMPLNLDYLKSRWIGDRKQMVVSVGCSSHGHQDDHPLEAGIGHLMGASEHL